ncbi:NAD(P)H-binding [Quadrisphaera granulorum]|uniref:Putative NAD(P)-binding protein n=1 Tax=Quadrisphaera granulorum TaxID=317664 RepID=A0A316AC27_9ACTN|nr:NAD(P)H-binding protein [Quadrisphaera granulorum]PWJ55336.1 putative NAD(P)-binding protein [Quadrisphaera granulorum]SZE95400.1 NAD(P)H-binding [Quadrisphaera granulorum]
MFAAIAGAHGQIARRLTRLLVAGGDEVVGLIRNPDHVGDVEADGARAIVLDLESANAEEVADAIQGTDAVVFAAGAGPGSGEVRKDTVDRAAAVLLADAAQAAGVRRYVLVSSYGVDAMRDGATPDGMDPVFVAYLRAKLAAEEELLGRALGGAFELAVLRPGGLTDEPGAGTVSLERSLPRGQVSRDDVAAVVAALLRAPALLPAEEDPVLELMAGEEPVEAAVTRSLTPAPAA